MSGDGKSVKIIDKYKQREHNRNLAQIVGGYSAVVIMFVTALGFYGLTQQRAVENTVLAYRELYPSMTITSVERAIVNERPMIAVTYKNNTKYILDLHIHSISTLDCSGGEVSAEAFLETDKNPKGETFTLMPFHSNKITHYYANEEFVSHLGDDEKFFIFIANTSASIHEIEQFDKLLGQREFNISDFFGTKGTVDRSGLTKYYRSHGQFGVNKDGFFPSESKECKTAMGKLGVSKN